MAMNQAALGKAIADLIVDANAPADMKAQISSQWTSIAGAIIDEIKKATITVTIPSTSSPGSPSAGTATIV
jgi:hypothetical protein